MNGCYRFEVGKGAAQEVAFLPCVMPSAASRVGWMDFDPEKGGDVSERCYVLLLLRSGRVVASRGDRLRPVPELLHAHIRLMCCQP